MSEIVDRITEYLASGGLFNPELMEHKKVRDLLTDARAEKELLLCLRTSAHGKAALLGWFVMHKHWGADICC